MILMFPVDGELMGSMRLKAACGTVKGSLDCGARQLGPGFCYRGDDMPGIFKQILELASIFGQ